MPIRTLITLAILLFATPAFAQKPDLTGVDLHRFATWYETLPPTPTGTGHIGPIESGEPLQIRYKLPKSMPVSFQVDIHNIVAFNGGGESYQLQIRRDSPGGTLIYDGAILVDDPWNTSHHQPLEVADKLTQADIARGWLDLYAVATTKGDRWTMYRDAGGGKWDMKAMAVENTPALRGAVARAKRLRDKGIVLIPMPQKIEPQKTDFTVTSKTRILLPAGASESDLFSAGLLRDEIFKLSGMLVPIRRSTGGVKQTDIVMNIAKLPHGDESYTLDTSGYLKITAGSSRGLFYAVQTTLQLIQRTNAGVRFQGARISDWPGLKYRMIQYDIARSQTVNVEHMKRVIRELARFKINQLMFYMEDDYAFSKYPFTGRPGTFTAEKVRELVAYAQKYHVELVPQLESLGHGWSLLHHPELADIRENGSTWVFCTSNPETWRVLDDMIGELASVFSNTRFIHLGCDEFEDDWMKWGTCPECKARIEKIGRAGLYAEHIRKLNEIARKHKRTMIFWTAHGGNLPEAKELLTVTAAEHLPKDIIPMEWLYYGPRDYPTLRDYKRAGYPKLYAAPGVFGFCRLYPDFRTSTRSVSTMYHAAVDQGYLGGCACTWELTWGNQLETTWYGLVYAANCAWNSNACDETAFERAFAVRWFGLPSGKLIPELHAALQLHAQGSRFPILWADPTGIGGLFWVPFPKVRIKAGSRWSVMASAATRLIRDSDSILADIEKLKTASTANRTTLDAIACSVRMHRAIGRKLQALDRVSQLYRQAYNAREQNGSDVIQYLTQSIAILEPLRSDYPLIISELDRVRSQRGGCPEDANHARSVAKSLDELIARLNTLRTSPDSPWLKPEELGL